MSFQRARRRGLLASSAVLALVLAFLPATAGADEAADRDDPLAEDTKSFVTLTVPDQTTLLAVVDGGYDLVESMERAGDGYVLQAFVSDHDAAALIDLGVAIEVEASAEDLAAEHRSRMAERQDTLDAEAALAADLGIEQIDTVVIARADYFTSTGNTHFLSVEAKNIAGAGPTMTLRWFDDDDVQLGQTNMSAFTDAGQYLYHRTQVNLAAGPPTLTVDPPSAAAGTYTGPQAGFGPGFTEDGFAGAIALVNDGSSDPTLGCLPLIGFPDGAIALVDRGECPFVEKVIHAQNAGAVAVVVGNNVAGNPIVMGGSDPAIVIPSLMISLADTNTVKAGLPASGSVHQPGALLPTWVSVTSSNGGYAEREVEDWLGPVGPGPLRRYFTGFFNHYPDTYEFDEIMDDLHAQYPDLTEIVELPFLTNGYRRPAQRVLGTTTANAVGVESHAWGHEGGNDIGIGFVNPGETGSALAVDVDGTTVTVSLATNAAGSLTSTAAQIVAAINSHPEASDLILAYTYRGNAGNGVAPASGFANLTDGLSAPEHVLREPYQVRALRIGKHRDGSKTGILAFSVEHAREWQTPLVSAETASRLLHNYATHHATRQLVDNLDIFLVFVVNPDGHLYSYYDFASQRRNMTRYCGVGQNNDFNARNTWGVDNNRNYTAYTGWDGYSGSSTSCVSDVFRGPAPLSEPESANVHWVAGAFPNIKFGMSIHSFGNYFMWSPGSYSTPGRITAPRPSFGEENFFWQLAERVLTEIKQHRGLSITPARTGPTADVLYSAAGNSGDMMWYDFDMFGFIFESGTSFQPSFAGGAGSEAWNQMMEFSNGLTELFAGALAWTRDRYAPTSWINEDISEPSDGPVGITFGFSEPVDIYYTTDGSNPTTSSAKYDFAGIREQGETLWFDETTTIKWFSVDMAGNVEGKYDPRRDNANTATILIND